MLMMDDNDGVNLFLFAQEAVGTIQTAATRLWLTIYHDRTI